MKRLIIDLDHTLCVPQDGADQGADPAAKYKAALPRRDVIEQVRRYREDGFAVVIHTSRNMRTYAGDVEAIRANTLPVILDWLAAHDVPFDDVIVGKPWCGFDGFYIDDRAVRPSEFVAKTYDEIVALMDAERIAG